MFVCFLSFTHAAGLVYLRMTLTVSNLGFSDMILVFFSWPMGAFTIYRDREREAEYVCVSKVDTPLFSYPLWQRCIYFKIHIVVFMVLALSLCHLYCILHSILLFLFAARGIFYLKMQYCWICQNVPLYWIYNVSMSARYRSTTECD